MFDQNITLTALNKSLHDNKLLVVTDDFKALTDHNKDIIVMQMLLDVLSYSYKILSEKLDDPDITKPLEEMMDIITTIYKDYGNAN